ncbi:hypothetical protein MST22_15595 [Virgibacillus halodenitrificans]|uniref:hypothetical protein n=1 Tax=Virgibacillus halodenitrificans TaxID=1482 RepID=UPI001FB3EFCB|nr:hypothetical protein [Virgibacillus halodenitrificans]MCJ0932571.1 hypothetical protein [Virgibacillus halodenitrificans]
MVRQKEWAVYKGDKFLFIGSTNECAARLGVKNETVRYYSTPTYWRKLEKRNNWDNSLIVVDLSELDLID